MALTPSQMLPLGTPTPPFELTDAILAGDAPGPDQKPSMGCNIKWTPGNAPAYLG